MARVQMKRTGGLWAFRKLEIHHDFEFSPTWWDENDSPEEPPCPHCYSKPGAFLAWVCPRALMAMAVEGNGEQYRAGVCLDCLEEADPPPPISPAKRVSKVLSKIGWGMLIAAPMLLGVVKLLEELGVQ